MRPMSLELQLRKEPVSIEKFASQMGLSKIFSRDDKLVYMYGNFCEIGFNDKINVYVDVLKPDYLTKAVELVAALLRKHSGKITEIGEMFIPFFDLEQQGMDTIDIHATEPDIVKFVRDQSYQQLSYNIEKASQDEMLQHPEKFVEAVEDSFEVLCLNNKHVIRKVEVDDWKFNKVAYKDIYLNRFHRMQVIFSSCVLGLPSAVRSNNWFYPIMGYRRFDSEDSYYLVREHYVLTLSCSIYRTKTNNPLTFNLIESKNLTC